jgi:hypothetical protein
MTSRNEKIRNFANIYVHQSNPKKPIIQEMSESVPVEENTMSISSMPISCGMSSERQWILDNGY